LSISDYIAGLESAINSSAIVSSYNLTIDRKTSDIAFVSGRVDFRDGTVLHFKEFVEGAEDAVAKYKYAYNYCEGSNCIFRYDNAPDPGAKGAKTFPHHKHLKDGAIAESAQVELSDVLGEIEGMYIAGEDR
jgi:hypothetical protein